MRGNGLITSTRPGLSGLIQQLWLRSRDKQIMPKLEFLLCGSPVDAFWSQAAMFRLSLDCLGPEYRAARVVFCVGAPHAPVPIPDRWRKWFSRIELHWADPEEYAQIQDGAQGHQLFRLVDNKADISVICDADSLLIARLPDSFISQMQAEPAVCGVIAHFSPSLKDYRKSRPVPLGDANELWRLLGEQILGRSMRVDTPYTLATDGSCGPSFYINHAFLAAPPSLMTHLGELQEAIRPAVRSVLDNDFYDQIAVAVAVEKGRLSHRALPMRFNYPNDPAADARYPEECENIVLLHYLRTNEYDRHKIFANKEEFDRFMKMNLRGSSKVFQLHIEKLTGGEYPFA
jgi:hypothetical protein